MRRAWRRSYWLGALLAALFAVWAPAAWAQDGGVSGAAPFVGDLFGGQGADGDWLRLDEESLFGGGLITEAETADQPLEEVFLVQDRLEMGGTYRAALEGGWWWPAGGASAQELEKSLTYGGSLFVDARPSRDLHFFGKVRLDGVLRENASKAAVSLHELFAEFVLGERAFVRAGKQTVKWGVGYFFSPADVINAGRIDPANPETEREGATALRVHVPAGRNNWYGYIVVDGDGAGGYRIALAPKAEFVAGRTEIGVGLFYREDRAPRAMATLSTSAGKLALFGELVLSRGTDKRLAREAATPLAPFGLTVVEDHESLFVQASLGARGSYSDPDGRFTVTAAAQYFYNGEGYGEAFLEKHGPGLFGLFQLGQLSAADLQWWGRHYAALSATGSHRALKNVSASAFWLAGLSDDSGVVSVTLAYTGGRSVRPSLTISHTYGDPLTQFGLAGAGTRVAVGLSVSGEF